MGANYYQNLLDVFGIGTTILSTPTENMVSLYIKETNQTIAHANIPYKKKDGEGHV